VPATIPFKLITPTKVVFEGEADLILAHHAPFLSALKPGVLRANIVEAGASKRLELATAEGFMQALPDRVTVLVDRALAYDEVDVAAARAELAEAVERQKSAHDAAEFAREQSIVDFANAKLRLTGH
jgi:F0F1-type ATP synthase epsilon subunit